MRRALKVAAFGTLIGGAGLYYSFPLLRDDWKHLLYAGIRIFRITKTASVIAVNYIGGITPEKHRENAARLYKTLLSNGGCYVKFGQAIAQLDLLVPQEYADAMKPMLNECQIEDFEIIKQTLEEELKQAISEVFIEFEKKPIASASLAQVHKAKLKNGSIVAVKVQHQHIREEMPGDIRVLDFLARTGKKLYSDFDYEWLIDDLKVNTAQELNFNIEISNALRCANIFKGDPYIKVPKMYTDFSTDKVVTMEFIDGVLVTNISGIQKMGLDFKDIAHTLSRAFNEMIFVHGFVHCDPHPGNILIRPSKVRGKAEVVLLDHGLYKELPINVKNSYSGMWKSIILKDEDGMKKHAAELGVTSMYPLLAGMMVGRPWEEIMSNAEGFEKFRNARAYASDKEALRSHALRWNREINQILGLINRDLVLLFKTFEWLRAIDAELGAPINTIQIIADYCTRNNTSLWARWWIQFKMWIFVRVMIWMGWVGLL
ncbi:unnamed protein product [Blepharisma stoltei]|uniref:ABC1 atypical kinase-like domain-containing protein n=1 Tax=Blepharisma stoltei TaxID=1481888 RepID=A0AAU9IIP4_9CILI|nr:unnamed protein product [Blepharisma stoltei]